MELDLKMSDIKAILFDKDGTLWSFQKTWGPWAEIVLSDLSERVGVSRYDLADAIGYSIENKLFNPESPVIAGTADAVVELLVPHLPNMKKSDIEKVVSTAARNVELAEIVPLEPLFTKLRDSGLKLGIATNDFEAVALNNLGSLDRYFDFIAGFDSGYGAKPDPGMLLAFCDHTGIAPEFVLMVGDSRHDLNAGRAAGMRTLAVLTGVATSAELADLADEMRPDIGHLPALLGV